MVFYTHYLNLENFPSAYSLCVLSFHLCFCLLFVVVVVVVVLYCWQIKRKNVQVSCSLVGTVTRLIRSRLLRSRGPHTFCVVGRKTKQNGEKENLCERKKCTYLSLIVGYVFVRSRPSSSIFFYIIHPWRSLRFVFVFFFFFSFLFFCPATISCFYFYFFACFFFFPDESISHKVWRNKFI